MWVQPVVLDNDKKTVDIDIVQEANGLAFEIVTSENEKKVTYAKRSSPTKDSQENVEDTKTYTIQTIKSRCTDVHTRKEIEDRLIKLGFNYRPSYLLTETIYCGEWEALIEMTIPDELLQTKDELLNPTILDCAFRSALGIKGELFKESIEISVPYELEKIEILKPIPNKCMAYAYIPDEQKNKWGEYVKSNVKILDENGEEVVRITGFCARKINNKEKSNSNDLLFYSSKWEKVNVVIETPSDSEKENVLVLCNSESIINELIEDT